LEAVVTSILLGYSIQHLHAHRVLMPCATYCLETWGVAIACWGRPCRTCAWARSSTLMCQTSYRDGETMSSVSKAHRKSTALLGCPAQRKKTRQTPVVSIYSLCSRRLNGRSMKASGNAHACLSTAQTCHIMPLSLCAPSAYDGLEHCRRSKKGPRKKMRIMVGTGWRLKATSTRRDMTPRSGMQPSPTAHLVPHSGSR
jgi:hypothetical protein